MGDLVAQPKAATDVLRRSLRALLEAPLAMRGTEASLRAQIDRFREMFGGRWQARWARAIAAGRFYEEYGIEAEETMRLMLGDMSPSTRSHRVRTLRADYSLFRTCCADALSDDARRFAELSSKMLALAAGGGAQ